MPRQINTKPVTVLYTMNSRAWKLGMSDYHAGLPIPLDIVKRLLGAGVIPSKTSTWTSRIWQYERGRLFAAETGIKRLSKGDGSAVSPRLIDLCVKAVRNKIIL
jgi:hypothetical protein